TTRPTFERWAPGPCNARFGALEPSFLAEEVPPSPDPDTDQRGAEQHQRRRISDAQRSLATKKVCRHRRDRREHNAKSHAENRDRQEHRRPGNASPPSPFE